MRRSNFLSDQDGKPSFGRLMLLLGGLTLIIGAAVPSETLAEAGRYLVTTFLAWEAHKRQPSVPDGTGGDDKPMV